MDSAKKPLVYFVLGATGSGRRDVVLDLIEGGLEPEDRPAVLLAETEPASPADARLAALARWSWRDGAIEATLPDGASHVFLIAEGRSNPVDQAEALKGWVQAQGAELGRVITIVNCQWAAQHPPLLAWYEACIHFSDVVLLNRREGVENKWLSDFQGHFKKQFFPCVFDFVKDGRVKNPALVLQTEARRMTHAFDEEQDWVLTNSDGEEIDEDEAEENEELQAAPEEDPYFARRNGGRRVKEIPDVTRFLPVS